MDIRMGMTNSFMLIIERCDNCVYFKATLVILAREFLHRSITFTRVADLYQAISNFRASVNYFNSHVIFSSGDLLPLFYGSSQIFGHPGQYDILISIVPVIILPRYFLLWPEFQNVSYYRWGVEYYRRVDVNQRVNGFWINKQTVRFQPQQEPRYQGRASDQLLNSVRQFPNGYNRSVFNDNQNHIQLSRENGALSRLEELTMHFNHSLNVDISLFYNPEIQPSNPGLRFDQHGVNSPPDPSMVQPPNNMHLDSITPRAEYVQSGHSSALLNNFAAPHPFSNIPARNLSNSVSYIPTGNPFNSFNVVTNSPTIAMRNVINNDPFGGQPRVPNWSNIGQRERGNYENILMEQLLDFEDDLISEQARRMMEDQGSQWHRNLNRPKNGENRGPF